MALTVLQLELGPRRLPTHLKRIGYTDSWAVCRGRAELLFGSGKENVMRAFGTNLQRDAPHIDDLYGALRGASAGPHAASKTENNYTKPEVYEKAESECMGTK